MDAFFDKLKDPRFFKENRLYPHSDHVAYAPSDTDMEDIPWDDPRAFGMGSSLRMYLNGEWKFDYSPDLAHVPEGFEGPGYDDSSWTFIKVPGHIQLQGFDVPQYVNIQYPWDGREDISPGQIPEEFNPAASYITYFTLPELFSGKRTFISFQGVESCFRLWLNGRYIGFSSDSFTPSEFELTPFLKEGENKLAVQVYKWYSGSWLEDQDFFRFSGIFRDVYLFAVPEHHVWDVKTGADYDPEDPHTGKINAVFDCIKGGACVTAQLFSPNGQLLDTKQVTVPIEAAAQKKNPSKEGGFTAEVEFDVQEPLLWSAEQPHLYRLKVTVSENGAKEEWFCQCIGIRHFEMSGNVMKLNGRRIVFKGVNRHEFSADGGRVVSAAELLKDLYTMKQNNINAIRLSHYPNALPIYELADALGFYLIDECNMETHGTWDMTMRGLKGAEYTVPGKNIQYMGMLLDRIHSMYQRDKNHSSILIWSLGNESSGGPVIHEMSRELKKLDRTRLVHYEGIFNDRSFPDTSDMESQMYAPVARIREYLSEHREKPFISCEYMHAMGNSCGALYKYTDLTDEDELYQGGFIWDYIDQALRKKDRYGVSYMAYGGDNGDRPNDSNFSGDGLVYADREPTPKLSEVKYCYQNIEVRFAEESFEVVNKNLFTATDAFECAVLLEKNGHELQSGQMDVNVPALSQQSFEIPFKIPSDPGEYAVTVSFRLKEGTCWAQAGYEIAFGQKIVSVKTDAAGFLEQAVSGQGQHPAADNLEAAPADEVRKAEVPDVQASEPAPAALGQDSSSKSEGKLKGLFRRREKNAPSELVRTKTEQAPAAAAAAKGPADNAACGSDTVRIINGSYNIGVKGRDFDALFSRLYGGLVSYRYRGRELLSGRVMPNFWRAPVDNDNGNMMPFRCSQWKGASLYADHKNPADLYAYYRMENPAVQQIQGRAKITYTYYLPTIPAHSCTLSYLVDASGCIEVTLEYEPPVNAQLPDFPEFGVIMKLDADHDRMEWFGPGPGDSYPDRKKGTKLGIYSSDVRDTVARYLVPQESGSIADVRWIRVTDGDGRGLAFACNDLSVNVSPYTPHELENALHPFELPPVHYTYVRIGRQTGLGGDDSWGAMPHEEFLLKSSEPRKITFLFRGI